MSVRYTKACVDDWTCNVHRGIPLRNAQFYHTCSCANSISYTNHTVSGAYALAISRTAMLYLLATCSGDTLNLPVRTALELVLCLAMAGMYHNAIISGQAITQPHHMVHMMTVYFHRRLLCIYLYC